MIFLTDKDLLGTEKIVHHSWPEIKMNRTMTIFGDNDYLEILKIPLSTYLAYGGLKIYGEIAIGHGCTIDLFKDKDSYIVTSMMGPFYFHSFEIYPPGKRKWSHQMLDLFSSFRNSCYEESEDENN